MSRYPSQMAKGIIFPTIINVGQTLSIIWDIFISDFSSIFSLQLMRLLGTTIKRIAKSREIPRRSFAISLSSCHCSHLRFFSSWKVTFLQLIWYFKPLAYRAESLLYGRSSGEWICLKTISKERHVHYEHSLSVPSSPGINRGYSSSS